MFDLVSVFGEVLLPVIVVVTLGYLFRRFHPIDTRPLNRISLYVLTPCLIFVTLLKTDIAGTEALGLSLQMALVMAVTSLCAWIASISLRLSGPQRSGFLLTTTFMNSGNYGLSIAQFAFGAIGFQYAVISFLTQALLGQTLAVYLASAGRKSRRAAIVQIFRLPLIYAALLGLGLRLLGVRLDEGNGLIVAGIYRGLQLLANASIPLLLLILGMQLANRQPIAASGPLTVATIIRLIISIPLAYGVGRAIGLSGLPLVVGTIQAAMPTAVNMIVLAVEFDAWPEFVSSAVVLTTLGSLVSLTLLIAVLR